MKILVCGGRNYGVKFSESGNIMLNKKEQDFLFGILNHAEKAYGPIEIIEGEAQGADRLSAMWAEKNGVTVHRFPADWKKHGKGAGPIRNRQMLVEGKPDLVIAFPGGNGTRNMIDQARNAGVTVLEFSKEMVDFLTS